MATLYTDISKEFRYLLLHIAEWLKPEECKGIVFVENLPPSYNTETALAILSCLEANGEYSPLNPDGLQELLTRLNRNDLVQQVKKYKESALFKKAQKKQAKEEKRKKKAHKTDDHEAMVIPSAEDKLSSLFSNPQSILRKAYAVTLTHTGLLLQQVELLRKAIDAAAVEAVPNNLQLDPIHPRTRTEAAFQAIAEAEDNVEKLRNNLRKALSAVGIRSSSSSDENSCTSGHPSPAPSPALPRALPRSKRQNSKPAHVVETGHLPGSIPEESNVSQGDSCGHVMQETNVSSDDSMHACYMTTPVHLRSLAPVQSDSYRQRSQSHSGTDDSPRIASHRKSLSQDVSKIPSMVSVTEDRSSDFTGGTGDSGYSGHSGDLKEWQIRSPPVLSSVTDSQQQSWHVATQETHHYTELLLQTRDEPSDYISIKHES